MNNEDDKPVYSVCMSPHIEEDDGKWYGTMDIWIEEYEAEDLSDQAKEAMRTCVGMLASAFVVMEEDDYVLEKVKEKFEKIYLDHGPLSDEDVKEAELQMMDKQFDQQDNKPKVSFAGNVIKLDFDTPTGGNA